MNCHKKGKCYKIRKTILKDFKKCKSICGKLKKCGHICKLKCHFGEECSIGCKDTVLFKCFCGGYCEYVFCEEIGLFFDKNPFNNQENVNGKVFCGERRLVVGENPFNSQENGKRKVFCEERRLFSDINPFNSQENGKGKVKGKVFCGERRLFLHEKDSDSFKRREGYRVFERNENFKVRICFDNDGKGFFDEKFLKCDGIICERKKIYTERKKFDEFEFYYPESFLKFGENNTKFLNNFEKKIEDFYLSTKKKKIINLKKPNSDKIYFIKDYCKFYHNLEIKQSSEKENYKIHLNSNDKFILPFLKLSKYIKLKKKNKIKKINFQIILKLRFNKMSDFKLIRKSFEKMENYYFIEFDRNLDIYYFRILKENNFFLHQLEKNKLQNCVISEKNQFNNKEFFEITKKEIPKKKMIFAKNMFQILMKKNNK